MVQTIRHGVGIFAHVSCLDAEITVGPESVVEGHDHEVEVDVERNCKKKSWRGSKRNKRSDV